MTKGLSEWFEAFKGGKQIDSAGKEHDGDALIDKAVSSFDATYHEPPLVIGHPKHDDPAYGWVAGLKTKVKDGVKYLFAKSKEVVPEFSDMVESGQFKKRSVKFYPDGRLRHIGFLGAMPPAVKGLANVEFSDEDEGISFEFGETSSWTWRTLARTFRNLREWLIEKEGKETADSIIPEWNIEDIQEEEKRTQETPEASEGFGEHINPDNQGGNMSFKDKFKSMLSGMGVDMSKVPDDALPDDAAAASFSEADLTAAKKKGAEEAKAEFAKKEKAENKKARDKEIVEFCENLAKEKKIPPSWNEAGLATFMQGLDAEKEIEFSEGAEEKKTGLAWMKDFLSGFGKSAMFSEMATKEAAAGNSEFSEGEIDPDLTMRV